MKIDKSLISGSTTMLILSLLAKEEMYGYQMILELARRSNRTFELKEGTLYPILHGLEAERLVTVREREADGRVRKYYRITKQGRTRVTSFIEEWNEVEALYRFVGEASGATQQSKGAAS